MGSRPLSKNFLSTPLIKYHFLLSKPRSRSETRTSAYSLCLHDLINEFLQLMNLRIYQLHSYKYHRKLVTNLIEQLLSTDNRLQLSVFNWLDCWLQSVRQSYQKSMFKTLKITNFKLKIVQVENFVNNSKNFNKPSRSFIDEKFKQLTQTLVDQIFPRDKEELV